MICVIKQGAADGKNAVDRKHVIVNCDSAKLIILDKDGKEIESWVSEEKPHYIEKLPVGKYTLRELTAPDGYEVGEDVKFKVDGTGEIQHVVMKDALKKQPATPTTPSTPTNPVTPTTPSAPITSTENLKKIPTTPKTGDDGSPLPWLLLFGFSTGIAGIAGIAMALQKRTRKRSIRTDD